MIYTNLENLKIKVEVKSYLKLGDNFKEWIDKTTFNLYKNRTKSELKTTQILYKLGYKFATQVFFFDSVSKKTYFLDFLLYERNTALEVDGGYHKLNKEYDKSRDLFFKSIGIKTIRIKNENVSLEEIRSKLKGKGHVGSNKELSAIKVLLSEYNKIHGTKHKII